MEAWENYEKADEAVKAFDLKHEPKKLALIELGKMLAARGWGAVVLHSPNAASVPQREIRGDYDPIDLESLGPPSVIDIVNERALLVRARSAAFDALPETLKRRLSGRERGTRLSSLHR